MEKVHEDLWFWLWWMPSGFAPHLSGYAIKCYLVSFLLSSPRGCCRGLVIETDTSVSGHRGFQSRKYDHLSSEKVPPPASAVLESSFPFTL